MRIEKLFNRKFASIIGMVHLEALAGTPKASKTVQQIVDKACEEATQYSHCGIDGIIIENMNDIPYVKAEHVGPEIVASMTTVAREVRRSLPAAMPIEGFVFSHVADEGLIDGGAGPLLRYRKSINAEHVQIFCDIKKKHSSHSITSDVSLVETAKAASFFLADGVILTGTCTGAPVDIHEFRDLRGSLPESAKILIGSGVDEENVDSLKEASALIIGSHFKENGQWQNKLDPERIGRFMNKVLSWH